MPDIEADFIIDSENPIETEYTIDDSEHFDCSFEIYASGTTFSNIEGSPYDNEALASVLNQKADNSTVEELSQTVTDNYNTLSGQISDEANTREQADETLDGKIDTHITDKNNPHEVTKDQVGLGNVDNTSDLNKPISTATQSALDNKQDTISDLSDIRSNAENGQTAYNTIQTYGDIVTYDAANFATSAQGALADTALQPSDDISELVNDVGYITMSALGDYATLQELENGLATKQDTINDLSDIRNDASNGASAYSTIQTYGDIVTYNASSFATASQGELADTALQPNDNITELNNNAGYITSASLPTVNNNKVTIQKNSTDVGSFTLNQSTDKTINLSIPTQASDINAVPTSRKVNNKALSSDITLSASDVSALSSSTTINDLTTTAQQDALNSGATSTNIGQIATNTSDISAIEGLIPVQATTTNQLADKSFVNSSIATNTANFIGTFQSVAELEAYSGTLTNNDYAFVETTDSAGNTFYDRYKYTTSTTPASWQFEYELNNSSFTSNQWASINSGITANDVTLIGTAIQPNDNVSALTNDAGYITSSSLPTVNNGTLTIQQNGTDVQTFTANQSTNATANITVPTDTNDLTNGAGYITGIDSTDISTALGYTPYNSSNPNGYITGITSTDVTTALGYTPYNSSNPSGYITGINSSMVTTALGYTPYDSSNPNGYTSNVGTVTSVNNTSPDSNGNVSLTIPTVNNGTLTITQNGTSKGTFSANQAGNDTISLTDTTYNAFTGADSITGGASGLVPAPSAGDEGKFLKGDGTWDSISGGQSTDVQINGTSITSGGVANILTNSAYNASSNKIATMSDVPSTSGLANTDLSNLSNTGNAKFQAPLVSGSNIKTINNTSLLGSGDISIQASIPISYEV